MKSFLLLQAAGSSIPPLTIPSIHGYLVLRLSCARPEVLLDAATGWYRFFYTSKLMLTSKIYHDCGITATMECYTDTRLSYITISIIYPVVLYSSPSRTLSHGLPLTASLYCLSDLTSCSPPALSFHGCFSCIADSQPSPARSIGPTGLAGSDYYPSWAIGLLGG